jgi:hypothetical protein
MEWSALRRLDLGRSPELEAVPAGDIAAQLEVLLFSGGGADVSPSPITGRTPDGCGVGPADGEIWFSSTTATGASRHARAAAADALARLSGRSGAPPMPLTRWFNSLRERIAVSVGFADASVILAPSPAEARDLARYIATALFGQAPVEIVASPEECSHFAEPLKDHTHRVIELRDAEGAPVPPHLVDARALGYARWSIDGNEPLLVHALDLSRSGLGGVSRVAARQIRSWAPRRALALVDASDFRADPRDLAADLADGMMVMISGSQFVAGPAHCAALLLPPAIAEALEAAKPLFDPEISLARFDAPVQLRGLFGGFDALMNIGLGLRWSAALAEFDRYSAIPRALRFSILDAFARKGRAMAARRDFADLEPRPIDEDDPMRASILTLFPRNPRGGRYGLLGASAIRAGLALPRPGVAGDVICHIGAPVRAGLAAAALPLSASAPMVSDVAARMARGISFERAIAPVWRDLETLFGKWEALAG